MAGTVITPAQVPGYAATLNAPITPSFVNSFRISAVTDRLFTHLRGSSKTDGVEFFNLCLSLARGIDYAITNDEIPSKAVDLPLLLKQVCRRKNDPLLQAAIMVLMISVKNACKSGWFSDEDNEELRILSDELGNSFCSARDVNSEESSFLPTISTIMSRFYPRMRMGQIVAFLEAKPGYGALVKDFHVSKNAKSSPEERIHLFVAQTDNLETSSCIITPLKVNFLLNGKGVERRTNVTMDTGPQIPTAVTHMLKYGTNLLQAVGQFTGHSIIVVAFMSVISNPSLPILPDFVQPAVAALDSDNEIIEGPSRISLNCPISFRRIKTPVKGSLCKHLQCFDYDNFVDINSRRPSWRCPHCNQSVCFPDIRIDQNMVKVLKEVGENVADVIISADGSWKAATDGDDHTHDKSPVGHVEQDTTSLPNALEDIVDLTEGYNEIDIINITENEDMKPCPPNFLHHSSVNNPLVNPVTDQVSEVNQNIASHLEDDFWSGIFLPSQGTGSDARSDTQTNQTIGGASESLTSNTMLSPVRTNAISFPLNVEPESYQRTLTLTTSMQSQFSVPNNMQLQQLGSSNSSNEYGRFPTMVGHVNRTPYAVQALPAQPSAGVPANVERLQQFSRPRMNPHLLSQMTSPLPLQHMGSQNWGHQDRPFISNQPSQQLGTFSAPTQQSSSYRVSPALPSDRLNSHQQQSVNQRIPHPMSQSPALMRSSAQPPPHLQHTRIHQGSTQSGLGSMTGPISAARRAAQMGRQSTSPAPMQASRSPSPVHVNGDAIRASVGDQRGNSGVTGQSIARAEGPVDVSVEQNWRPTGRMRGSLSGRAYNEALNQYIIQPTQPVQPPRPLPNMTPPQFGLPPQLQVLMANRIAAQEGSIPLSESGVAGAPGMLPGHSSGMQ